MKIAILDIIGLEYNGNTLNEKGLGGSESAIIYVAQELVKIGFDVTVYNKCDKPGIYDGVKYLQTTIENLNNVTDIYDILITSRSLAAYATDNIREYFMRVYQVDPHWYRGLVRNSKYKVLWLHDTFCSGDEFMHDLLADRQYDEIFTLSDWHAMYVAMAQHHGVQRYPEFFKSRMFFTRNGLKSYHDEIDLSKKDKNLFVYNASISKGMIPLLKEVWPRVKEMIPQARLKIIGGYYQFSNDIVDQFQSDYLAVKDEYNAKYDIEFTGIIKQSEIADIMKEATFFLYPGVFPETFGISVTEALNTNTLMIGYSFGALEEIAPNKTSYKVEFFHGYKPIGIEILMEQVSVAYFDDYRRQQKQYACNEFKEFLGWDVVALQWKHHFYRKLNKFLPLEETLKHRYNISNINKIYNKKLINTDEYVEDFSYDEKNPIVVVSPVYNAENYIKDHILSVAGQVYRNYKHIIIDDMSTDNTALIAKQTIATLQEDIRENFIVITNKIKKYAVRNQVETIVGDNGWTTCADISLDAIDPIIVLLDGDDTLVNDPDVFNYINGLYNKGNKFTYGSCRSIADSIDLIAQPYPKDVLENKTFRNHKFSWGMPYTHLRTFKRSLFNKVNKVAFKDENGDYWKAGGDNAMFYPLIEQCEPHEIKCVQRVLVSYNDANPLNDYKVNSDEQTSTAETIRLKKVAIDRLKELSEKQLIPKPHVEFLFKLKEQGIEPKVIYDIGSCVLHWSNIAKKVWPGSEIIHFEAMDSVEVLYKENNVKYALGVLSDEDGKVVDFYKNDFHPGGNSYYKENSEVNPKTTYFFNEGNKNSVATKTLETTVKENGFPIPDFIKMDVQGAELDIVKGSIDFIKQVPYLILELQAVEYNKGAPLEKDVIVYLEENGFEHKGKFSSNTMDGDHFFINKAVWGR